jgi:hypothetical protein
MRSHSHGRALRSVADRLLSVPSRWIALQFFERLFYGPNPGQSSRRRANLLFQVRCAVYNGTVGSDFGQKFQPANDPFPPMAGDPSDLPPGR